MPVTRAPLATTSSRVLSNAPVSVDADAFGVRPAELEQRVTPNFTRLPGLRTRREG